MHQKLIWILVLLFTFSFAQDEFFEPKTTIGGYGELHYNYSKMDDSDPQKMLDFHRFVLFYGHSWTENWSFRAEVELEHNFVKGGQGELELEQAYVNYQHSPAFGFRAGVLLPSAGFINEFHEPPLFLSVERPDYAKVIIPTTWFGNGAGIYGRFNNLTYKAIVLEGLDGSAISAKNGIRDARQKGYKSNAQELLYNVSLNYDGINGLIIGGSFSYNDAFVSQDTTLGMTLVEIHAKYEANNIISVFEYGNISYDVGKTGFAVENAMGYYFDLGYDIAGLLGIRGKLVPWFRYTDYNTASAVKGAGITEKEFHFTKWLIGLSFRPINEVVFKADYGISKRESDDQEVILFNLGAGYMF